MSSPLQLINGEPVADRLTSDRGLCYGHGLFETIRCLIVDGSVSAPLWSRHMARLLEGCRRLHIPISEEQLAPLVEQRNRLLAQAGYSSAIIKIIVTAGAGGRGYTMPDTVAPTVIIQVHEWVDEVATAPGIKIRTCDYRLPLNSTLAGIKHLNRLDQVMARAEWSDTAIAEGLMLDAEGYLVEGTMTNLFAVIDGQLITPKLDRCGVAGVMRAFLIDAAEAAGMAVSEQRLLPAVLATASEFFLCNSLRGILPVTEWQGRTFEVGSTTCQLQAAVAALWAQQ